MRIRFVGARGVEKRTMANKPVTNFHDADAVKKLLDNGWSVMVFKNALGSYTAFARPMGDGRHIDAAPDDWIVDGFEPSKVLHAITEKVLKCGFYKDWPPKRLAE